MDQVTAQRSNKERGVPSTDKAAVGLVLLSSLLYMLGYSLSKKLVDTFGLTALQVTFLRCALVLTASCGALIWPRNGMTWQRLWRPAKAGEQRAAAAALVISNILAILAFSLLPMTEASALNFTAPLLLTAFSGLLLRERVTLNRWIGAGIGFVGMLLIVKPGASPASFGIMASIGAAMAYAVYQILIRRLKDVATSLDTVVQVALVGVVLLVGAMFVFWHHIGLVAFALVLVVTVVQTAALASIAAAVRRSEASRLAPWQFSGLLWAILLDAVMFRHQPSIGAVAGGGLIIAGGLLAQSAILQKKHVMRV